MKTTAFIIALIASFALAGCQTEEAANDKLEECIEDEFGDEAVDEMIVGYEVTCDEYDSEEDCDECIECVVDADCEDIFAGECDDNCI
jgi:hypothetical protein